MQFQTICTSQCRDISQKPNFGPNLGLNGPNLSPKNFVQPLFDSYQLNTMPVYHNMQNQENLTIQTRENGVEP